MTKIKTLNFPKFGVYNRQNYIKSYYTYNWIYYDFRNLPVCNSVSEGLVTFMMLFSTNDPALNLGRFSYPPSQEMLRGTQKSRSSFRGYQDFYYYNAESDHPCDLSFLGHLKL